MSFRRNQLSPPPSSYPDERQGSQFLPASAVDRFIALRRLGQVKSPQAPPTGTSNAAQPPPAKQRKIDMTKGDATFPPAVSTRRSRNDGPFQTVAPEEHDSNKAELVVSRPYDLLSPPGPDIHRYIASTRPLQNAALVHALLDPNCANIQLLERDVEHLRELLPESTPNRLTTYVEADLVLDEETAIILYPLRLIGQSSVQDPDAGLNELIAVVARIGPRYKMLWIIFEEYSASRSSTPLASKPGIGRSPLSDPPLMRLDPYAGPVMQQLNKLMAWIPFTHEQRGWLSRLRHQKGDRPRSITQELFQLAFSDVSELPFETRLLFASDERCAAWLARAIGEGIAARIDHQAKLGVRRPHDGWQNRDEWVWREWLSEQDSTVPQYKNNPGSME
ncbi:hypothetical protein EDD11_006250 [Mortierella claussenii]|nr:hypothetical protein EDD11_006250 [Mortierella claussenii]